MKLTVDGKGIEVKPLTYKQAKQFRPRFEEWDKARKAAGESGGAAITTSRSSRPI
jgi:hypothetical protein